MSPLKRIFDISFSLILGFLLSPVLVGIAVAMKLTSPGGLLFSQDRLGLGGRKFVMYKFRKFPADWGTKGPGLTMQFDTRMTGVGRFLERTKLDELPQLWNIFIGEMSFVGPRPAPVSFSRLFVGKYKKILDYKPGIFGPNQTRYRNESAMYPADEDPMVFYERVLFPDKANRDLEYSAKATFLSDLYWIARNLVALLGSVVIWRRSAKVSAVLLFWDICAVFVGWVAAFWLKYSVKYPEFYELIYEPTVVQPFKFGLVATPIILLFVFVVARVYRHPVRHFSETDAQRLIGANCFVWMLSAIVFGVLINSSSSMVLAVACILSTLVMLLPRVTCRQLHFRYAHRKNREQTGRAFNVLVCGVDQQTLELCSLLSNGFQKVNLVGLLTDSKHLRSREVHGVKVLGDCNDLELLNLRYEIDQVWIGTSFEKDDRKTVSRWCEGKLIEVVKLDELAGFKSLIVGEKVLQSGKHSGYNATKKDESAASYQVSEEM